MTSSTPAPDGATSLAGATSPDTTTRPAGLKGRRRVVPRVTALTASALLVAGAAALTWWGAVDPAEQPAAVRAASVSAPATDTVYACPAGPANTIGGVSLGETSSSTVITPLNGSAALTYQGKELASGAASLASSDGGVLSVAPVGSTATGAAGSVTTVTASGDLRGLTAAACVPPSSVAWIVGGSTAVGSSSELRLTNPGGTTATATVHLYGSTGELTLPSGGQIAVPAGGTATLLLESSGAQDERIAVSIESDGGTLAASLATESLDGETPAGTEVLTSGATPATELTIPGVVLVDAADQGETAADAATGTATSSDAPVIRVVNPGTEAATVSVSLIGADGETPLGGATDLVVDPGAVFDVSLTGVAKGAYGVRITSDQPVAAAARLVRSAGEYPEKSGALLHDVAWAQAAPSGAAESATASLPRENGVSPQLVLTNAGSSAAEVELRSTDGSWDETVTVPAGTTATPEIPSSVTALRISTASGAGVSAAVVLTAEAGGDEAGSLVSVLPVVPDAQALGQRSVVLR